MREILRVWQSEDGYFIETQDKKGKRSEQRIGRFDYPDVVEMIKTKRIYIRGGYFYTSEK